MGREDTASRDGSNVGDILEQVGIAQKADDAEMIQGSAKAPSREGQADLRHGRSSVGGGGGADTVLTQMIPGFAANNSGRNRTGSDLLGVCVFRSRRSRPLVAVSRARSPPPCLG